MNLIAKTTCPYCGVGCGVDVLEENDEIAVRGDVSHPANKGRLCVKGAALAQTLDDRGRLLYPEIGGVRSSWQAAINEVASRIQESRRCYGPGSIAFYLSGQLLTEDYYVANKLIKGFIGSPNVDTNSRLCMSSAVAAQKRAFGEDVVPGCYDDLEIADLCVFVGSNAAWTHPVLFQRIMASKEARPDKKIVVIDPRQTDTAECADLFVQIAPGTDLHLFAGLFNFLVSQPGFDKAVARERFVSFDEVYSHCRNLDIAAIADHCRVPAPTIVQLYEWFRDHDRTVSFYSQGINQSANGTDGGNAIINCHAILDRIDRPGATAFSVTGQPNAMGGREVGGLANQLAAHMDYNDHHRDIVGRFWRAPELAAGEGTKAIDLFSEIESGRIKFVWIMATNPLVSLPEAARFEAALRSCETVVVSECTRKTDTTAVADILLPATTWGEKEGTVTNSERRISRQRAFRQAPGEARPDWWIIKEVAAALGFGDAFAYEGPSAIFAEHAALSEFENDGSRLFNIGALKDLDTEAYDALTPVQWPVTADEPRGTARAKVRAQLVAVTLNAKRETDGFVLNTGRLRDQWHTMTRTGNVTDLIKHTPEPMLGINEDDAARLGVRDGELVEIKGRGRRVLMRARLDAGLSPGNVFAPIHFSRTNTSSARIDDLVEAVTDPVSGQPALKHARVEIAPYPTVFYHVVVTSRPVEWPRDHYWVQHELGSSNLYLMAAQEPDLVESILMKVLGEPAQQFRDSADGTARLAWTSAGMLAGIWICTAVPGSVEPWWLVQQIGKCLKPGDRRNLLTGYRAGETENRGPLVCSCFQVHEQQIAEAIRAGGSEPTAQGVGEKLRCGTNCGSCVPQINRIIRNLDVG